MCYSIVFVFDSCIYFQMKKLYSWHDVAKRTEIVYDRALRCSNQNLLERLSRYEKRIHIFVISYLPNCGLGQESLKMGMYCDLQTISHCDYTYISIKKKLQFLYIDPQYIALVMLLGIGT